jgi:glycerophosphoryl diester phosphodiesterase
MHDITVDRTTNGTGLVQQYSLEQWQLLNAGDGHAPPSLRQVLTLVAGRCDVNIELKSNDLVHQVAAEITYAVNCLSFELKQLCVSAFDHRVLMVLKDILPQANIAPLIASCPITLSQLAADMGAEALHSDVETTDTELVHDAHTRGLVIRVFTIKQAEDLLRLKKIGVDAVFVNDVAWARRVLSAAV